MLQVYLWFQGRTFKTSGSQDFNEIQDTGIIKDFGIIKDYGILKDFGIASCVVGSTFVRSILAGFVFRMKN